MSEEIQILNEIEKAAALCEKTYTHTELFEVINTEDDFEKQICLLKLETLTSQEEADLLVFQLTEHHGLIREAAAIKINEFIQNDNLKNYFLKNTTLESLLKAVNDINPNICRLICAVLPSLFVSAEEEKSYFLKLLYERFEFVFEELERLKRSNWYTKKLFNIYWCLEALAMLDAEVDEKLENVLVRAANLRDYTIREKAAFVLSSLSRTSEVVEELKEKLKKDENFYVQRYAAVF